MAQSEYYATPDSSQNEPNAAAAKRAKQIARPEIRSSSTDSSKGQGLQPRVVKDIFKAVSPRVAKNLLFTFGL